MRRNSFAEPFAVRDIRIFLKVPKGSERALIVGV